MERLPGLRPALIALVGVLGAALAADPVLGPQGWTWLGPLPPAADEWAAARDTVVFDPESCAVAVTRVDLDGGPENHDVRLARVWSEGAWRWADDWTVRDGRLFRPGRAPVPIGAERRFEGETLALDPDGRVVARRRAGRVVEVLRDASGAFRGMRGGVVEVRIEGEADARRGVGSDGRTARWRWEGTALRSVADEGGVRSLYTYASDGALATVGWPDGRTVVLTADGPRVRLQGVGGAWVCEVRAGGPADGVAYRRVSLGGPAGAWTIERVGEVSTVTDPAGGTTRTRWAEGRLAGWIDPRGGETRLARDARGQITEVTDPSGARWGLGWGEDGLGAVVAPDGARWAFARDRAGAVVRVDEPSGRSATWERDGAGRLQGVRVGAARWGVTRDAAGRVVTRVDPVGAGLTVTRDASGAVVGVRDGAGGAWRVARDARGRVVAVDDPGAARWEITRDSLGQPVAVRDPNGAWTRWSPRETGAPERVTVGGGNAWGLLWNAAGVLTGLRDPLGRTTGWSRDALGRARAVHRADGSVVRIERDAAGDIVGVDDVRVRRDASGRPLALERGDAGLYWDVDGAGRVVGVTAPGVGLGLDREPGGAIREVRVDGSRPVRLFRDAQGRVVRAEGETGVELTRDAAGRIGALTRDGSPRLRIERDMRGLPARLFLGDRAWILGRDASGRVVTFDAPGGVRLGVDRDAGGRPLLARFPTSALARFAWSGEGGTVTLADRDGREEGHAGWTLDASGLFGRLQAGITWLFRRDPLGTLVAVEGEAEAWSSAPDGVDGPGGAFVRYDADGRPTAARLPTGWGGAWGLGEGDLRYVLDKHGAIEAIAGGGGVTRLHYDGAGRLVAWEGGEGGGSVTRDALGRLAGIGRVAVEGWEGLLSIGGDARATLPGIAVARPGGGVLLDPRGTPLLIVHGGPVASAPMGALGVEGARETGAAGRLRVGGNGPLLGLVDALDPVSGQPVGPAMAWPWSARAWEASTASGPFPDPDAAAVDLSWDPGPWAPGSPWSDPLALLVAAGELPDGGPRVTVATGLPWLPGALAPERPAPVPDPYSLPFDEEPIVGWILDRARAPTTAASPADLAALLVGDSIAAWIEVAPGLAPPVPDELGG